MTSLIKIILLSMFVTVGLHQLDVFQTRNINNSITIQNLSKKWQLEKYKVFFYQEAPAENEKNDYIHLNDNMTFTSVSEGVFDEGNWRLDVAKKRLYLSKQKEEGELVLIIDDLKEKQLVLIIDDPSDSDAQYLKIYFVATKK